jgi:hypothetical protein
MSGAAGVDIAGVDIAGVDIAGVDIDGVDIAGVDVAGTDIAGVDVVGPPGGVVVELSLLSQPMNIAPPNTSAAIPIQVFIETPLQVYSHAEAR